MGKFNFHKSSERGQTMVELAFALPLLLLILLGTVLFGLALNNYLMLTFATNAGAQQLSISRGSTSDPCATVRQTVENAAPGLVTANLNFSIALGSGSPPAYGTAQTGKGAGTAIFSCSTTALPQSDTALVTVTYPCSLKILTFNPACTLTAQTAVLIQ